MSQQINVELTIDFDNTEETEKFLFENVSSSVLANLKSSIQAYTPTAGEKYLFVSNDYTPTATTPEKGLFKSIVGARIITIEETEIEPT